MKKLFKNERPTCETCIYYKENVFDKSAGVCIRSNPKSEVHSVVHGDERQQGKRTVGTLRFPRMMESEVCGEWYFIGMVDGDPDVRAMDYRARLMKVIHDIDFREDQK